MIKSIFHKIVVVALLVLFLVFLRSTGCTDPRHRPNYPAPKNPLQISLISSAQAQSIPGVGKWEELGTWHVYGNTRARFCTVITRYEDIHMAISFTRNDVSLMLLGVRQVRGQVGDKTHHFVALSGGQSGVFEAHIPSNGVVVFRNLNAVTVSLLASSDEIAIEGIGRFSLAGSAEAIRSGMECYFTLNTL